MHNMNILCGTVLRISSHRIKYYTDSDGDWNRRKFLTFTCHTTAHSYSTRYNTTQTTWQL